MNGQPAKVLRSTDVRRALSRVAKHRHGARNNVMSLRRRCGLDRPDQKLHRILHCRTCFGLFQVQSKHACSHNFREFPDQMGSRTEFSWWRHTIQSHAQRHPELHRLRPRLVGIHIGIGEIKRVAQGKVRLVVRVIDGGI